MKTGIPVELLSKIVSDAFYKRCCLCRSVSVQLHHNLIHGGRQVNEKFCILPLCPSCHAIEKRKDVHEKLDWMMTQRATDDELARYSKIINWAQRKVALEQKYGKYQK